MFGARCAFLCAMVAGSRRRQQVAFFGGLARALRSIVLLLGASLAVFGGLRRSPQLHASSSSSGSVGAALFAAGGASWLPTGRSQRVPRCRLAVETTGRTRAAQPPPGIWFEKPEKIWPPTADEFKYGWNSELGKWQDLPNDMILKWWQQPGYLTPNGYRRPPHWSKKTYKIACQEMSYGMMEAAYVKEMKNRGMTMEEIRARAACYEFVENDGSKMTEKMRFLMQVKCLHDGRQDDLIDIRSAEIKRRIVPASKMAKDAAESKVAEALDAELKAKRAAQQAAAPPVVKKDSGTGRGPSSLTSL